MAERIKVALITHAGGAHVGAYLQALAATEDCSAVLLADPDDRWNDEARKTLGDKLTRTWRDYRELLAAERPEMVLLTCEARLAPPIIAAALDANCHVFAEKPACVRPQDFAPLARKADSQHRHLMLALANRLNPEALAARTLIETGKLGTLYGLEMHLVADQNRLTRPAYHQQWFARKARAGGGHLLWLGIHWLDLAMHITGREIREVSGFLSNVGGQPLDVEDSAAAALRFDNGMLGTMTSGYYTDRGYHSHLKIWGSDGWLHLDHTLDRPLSWVQYGGERAGELRIWDGPKQPRGYTPFVQAAVRACAGMSDPPISSAHSLRALETVFAIYDSAADGRSVTLARTFEGG